MEVILLQKIANLGDIGDRVKVKPGYGRNFLLPRARRRSRRPTTSPSSRAAARSSKRRRPPISRRRKQRAAAARGIQAQHHRQGGQRRQALRLDRHGRHRRGLRRRPAIPSSARKCACRAGRSAWSASTSISAAPARRHRHPCRSRSSPKSKLVGRPMDRRSCRAGRSRRDRAPPHSVEAEQAVLGGLMLDSNAWDAVADSSPRRGLLSPRPPAHLRGDRRASRRRASPATPSRSPSTSSARGGSRRSAGSPTSARSRATRPSPPTSAPMPRSSASARCCGSCRRRRARSRPPRPTAEGGPRTSSWTKPSGACSRSPSAAAAAVSGFVAAARHPAADDRPPRHAAPDAGRDQRRPDRLHAPRPHDRGPAAGRPGHRSRAARRWARRRSRSTSPRTRRSRQGIPVAIFSHGNVAPSSSPCA